MWKHASFKLYIFSKLKNKQTKHLSDSPLLSFCVDCEEFSLCCLNQHKKPWKKKSRKNPHLSFSETGWLASIKPCCCHGNGCSAVIGGWRCPAASRLEDSHWTSTPVSHNTLHDAAAQASIPLWMWPDEEVGSTRSNQEMYSVYVRKCGREGRRKTMIITSKNDRFCLAEFRKEVDTTGFFSAINELQWFKRKKETNREPEQRRKLWISIDPGFQQNFHHEESKDPITARRHLLPSFRCTVQKRTCAAGVE